MAKVERRRWAIGLLLILLGILLHLAPLGQDSLWLDEAFSVQAATNNDAATLWSQKVDTRHPPLYYILLRQTLITLGSESEAAARLPSALASLLNLALLYWLARLLSADAFTAWLTVALLALAPLSIWYAAEARMYALVTTAGLLLAVGLAADRWWGSLPAFAGLAAGLVLDYTIIPLWVGLVAVWLVYWWYGRRRLWHLLLTLAAMGGAWWLFRPFLPHLLRLLDQIEGVYIFGRLARGLGVETLSGGMLLAGLAGVGAGIVVAAAVRLGGVAGICPDHTPPCPAPLLHHQAHPRRRLAVCGAAGRLDGGHVAAAAGAAGGGAAAVVAAGGGGDGADTEG